jgi:predicted MFS family arabinose efflux permease
MNVQPAEAFPQMSPAELRAAFFRVFPSVALAIVIAAADQTIVATALPAIAGEFGALDQVTWVVVAYLIAATIAAPVFGRLADAFGRSRLLLAGLVTHAAGTALCAVAGSFGALILGRLVQGCGGGALTTLTMALIGEALPPRERGRFQAYIASCFVLASSAGPLVGGWLTQHQGWRACFWAMLPLLVLAFALALRLPRRRPPGAGQGFSFDALGALLFAGFVGPALLAFSQLQRLTAAALPLAFFLGVAASAALFLLWCQERTARHPLLPLSLLAQPVIWKADLMSGLVHGAFVSLVTFLPIYLQTTRGLAPAAAGALLLPFSIGGFLGGMLAGQTMTRTGLAMILPSIGLPIATALLLLAAIFAGDLSDLGLALVFGLAAMGMSTSYPVVQITVQVAAGPARLGAAAASVQFARSLGAAAATALLGALLFGSLAARDPAAATLFSRLVREGAGLLPTLPGEARTVLAEALASGFRAAFLGAAGLVALGAVLAWRVPMRRL